MSPSNTPKIGAGELQFASFRLGDLLLGIDIHQVQEINRNLDITPVPHSPPAVRGVINLRGEVVTVIDLRAVLGLPAVDSSRLTRNVVVQQGGERIGLLVDSIADVVKTFVDDIDPLPENLGGIDHSFFTGVVKLDEGLLVIMNVTQTLDAVCGASDQR